MSKEAPKELPTTPEFDSAAKAVSKFPEMPKNVLEFYGLYKFAKFGAPPAQTGSWFGGLSREGYKHNAWVEVSKSGITPEEAQKKYIALYEEEKKKHEAAA